MQKLKILIIGLETTGYETIHEILLTLACYLGGATLHSAVVSLNQRDACLKQTLFHPFLNRASLALEEIAVKTKLVVCKLKKLILKMQIKAYYSTQTSIDVCKLLGFTNY